MPDERNLMIMKTVLPYLKPPMKDTFKICIQLFEIQNTMERLSREEEELEACSINPENASIYNIYQAIREYCTPREAETIDMLISLTQMAQFYKDFEAGGDNSNEQSRL